MDEEINYFAHMGEVLPDGNLRVSTFGRSAQGERRDGYIIATPEHPNYALWLSQTENKDSYWSASREELKQAREQRRQKRKTSIAKRKFNTFRMLRARK